MHHANARCSSRGEVQLVASQECNVARGEDHDVVCARLRGIDTTISRGSSRLWPSGLQDNSRHTRIAWPSISLATAGRSSAICARECRQSENLATLEAKESLFEGERHAHSSCHMECFHAGRPLRCMLRRVQHTHAPCASICATRTNA